MIFLFEDNEQDIISQFFKKAYPEDIASEFKYASGNGRLLNIVKEHLASSSDSISVYFDMIPGNKNITKDL